MQLVLLIPVQGADLPGFGGGIPAQPGHPSTGPVYPPGHPSAGLPIAPGHPANRPPNVPPNVTWPPSLPSRPDNTLPPELSGNRPTNPIQLPEGQPLPEGAAFVAIYTNEKGWHHAVIKGSGSGIAQPK